MSRLSARVVVWLRWPLALAIVAGVVVAAVQLPSLQSVDSGTLGNLVPPDSQAIGTETESR